jgi:hypothetical protein
MYPQCAKKPTAFCGLMASSARTRAASRAPRVRAAALHTRAAQVREGSAAIPLLDIAICCGPRHEVASGDRQPLGDASGIALH